MKHPHFVIYWLTADGAPQTVTETTLNAALAKTKLLRDEMPVTGIDAITMVSYHPERVGVDGVDTVANGHTPDGVPYTWNKASRIGATRKRS